jgi:hypothetical protein
VVCAPLVEQVSLDMREVHWTNFTDRYGHSPGPCCPEQHHGAQGASPTRCRACPDSRQPLRKGPRVHSPYFSLLNGSPSGVSSELLTPNPPVRPTGPVGPVSPDGPAGPVPPCRPCGPASPAGESVAACHRLLALTNLPDAYREQTRSNLRFAEQAPAPAPDPSAPDPPGPLRPARRRGAGRARQGVTSSR